MAKAIALFSGGIDSTLAILTMLKQGVKVEAIIFRTPFGCVDDRSLSSNDRFSVAEKFGFEVRPCNLSDKFIEIVKNPEFGYGRNMNPCVDCRILMLKEARVVMDTTGADFIITGEVIGQRPMSQRRDTFNLIDREAGVTDYVLRPLSAKLLKVTVPESKGIIRREMLYGFSGRSRKPQIALAEEFGLTDYPSPAGGCLLTEPNYAHRLKDLLTYNPAPGFRDVDLLRIGRHFRFSPSCKIIVGRNKIENEAIESLSVNGDYLIKVDGCGSPITLVSGEITDDAIKVAASICARYSDAKDLYEVETIVINGDNTFRLSVSPAGNEIIEALRIELKSPITKMTAK
jgi:tRNA-specific 2-thiouridylase